eukprot:CAMPEP_0114291074 /NCGR_PEP_ID=MMETSP0059-20121206/8287_1 /TAXON_ID=36894 /ORGANISM="Pyramimonas parkeae, Strain CCMP726" /LENGTH=545 /DNA_ID=CAMNT_0001412537 /DNA_START=369 /DNA_END=2007 /DNA_ORIENTATION=-
MMVIPDPPEPVSGDLDMPIPPRVKLHMCQSQRGSADSSCSPKSNDSGWHHVMSSPMSVGRRTSSSSMAPYQDTERHDTVAKHLREVFDAVAEDGSKEILFCRACAPTDDKIPNTNAFGYASDFKDWHPPEVALSGVDPSLTDLACLAAGSGVPPEMLEKEGCAQFGGLDGGLQGLVALFAPEVVVTSPHSSALQTALIACKSDGDCPIIVHPDLKHIKKDLTLGGLYPEGKPKFQGVTVSALEKALQRQPYRDTAARVDLSNLEEVWFNPNLDFKGQKRLIRNIPTWLSKRPEQRIMVITHNRVLRHLVGAKVGNGQYALARLSTSGDLYTMPAISSFVPRFDAHGDEEDLPPKNSTDVKQLMFVRHCQDEVFPVKDNRAVSERFANWHSAESRELDTPENGRRDPCLTELGIRAASTGIDDTLRCQMNRVNGYGGIQGGLNQITEAFAPELVVTSPLSRAIQTALVAFDHSDVPVLVHPHIKELKKDHTFNGRYPEGKPGCAGTSLSLLRKAIDEHPRASGAPIDTSLVTEENGLTRISHMKTR